MAEYEHHGQPFAPVWSQDAEILILGTFPSVKSRENNFYYGHPQNRFWKVLAGLYDETVPSSVEEKKSLLLRRHIAIWDVIESCDIIGSSDSSIKNVVPADIAGLIRGTRIERVYVNGTLAKNLYDRFILETTGIDAVKLPSTSPANARFSLEQLIESWSVIL